MQVKTVEPDIIFLYVEKSESGNNTLVAALTRGKRIRVHQAKLMAASAVTIKFQSGASGTDLDGGYPAANGGYVLPYSKKGWFETAAETLLNLNLSGAVSVIGCIGYSEV